MDARDFLLFPLVAGESMSILSALAVPLSAGDREELVPFWFLARETFEAAISKIGQKRCQMAQGRKPASFAEGKKRGKGETQLRKKKSG